MYNFSKLPGITTSFTLRSFAVLVDFQALQEAEKPRAGFFGQFTQSQQTYHLNMPALWRADAGRRAASRRPFG